jgi:Tol biopolymer transport system component
MDNAFIYGSGGKLYRIPVAGGVPSVVDSTMPGRQPGPEPSPDGAYTYYSAEKDGRMQVWRKRADGSEAEALTSDEYNNWFPHLSPDGLRLVFLSYPDGTRTPKPDEADYGDVFLRVMTLADRKVTTIAKIVGGRGTIDLPSWSPDSRRLAFISYMLLP